MMCRLLEVSRPGFYAWQKRPVSKSAQRRELVGDAVEAAYIGFKKRYGAPRLKVELNEQGIDCSLNHVAQLLKERGLRARNGKGFKYRARTESKTNVSDNLLNREFEVDEPNRKWVSDITYIKVGRNWLYLAVVMELFSRKVIGWSLKSHMRESLIIEAFNMAASQRDSTGGVLLHSDRGVQYRGHEYQAQLKNSGVQSSMSRKGNCWDNAPTERFFRSLKFERLDSYRFVTRHSAETEVLDYITYYNSLRLHSTLGYKTPMEYEKKLFRKVA